MKNRIPFNEQNAYKRRKEIARIFQRFGLTLTIDLRPPDPDEDGLYQLAWKKYDDAASKLQGREGFRENEDYIQMLLLQEVWRRYHDEYLRGLAKLREKRERAVKKAA
jgi:hypothetical protein